jgi:hypothetical protein
MEAAKNNTIKINQVVVLDLLVVESFVLGLQHLNEHK